jgi:hypothetical protein
MRRYRVQGQEDWKEDGIQRRGPGVRVDGVGEGITRPGERGAALDEFLGRGVGRWFDAGVGEEPKAIGGRWQGDLGGFAEVCECCGGHDVVSKEGCGELVDFFDVGGVDQKVDREVGSEVSEAGGCEGERGRRVAQAERYYVVRVCDVLAEVNGVVGEGAGELASNLVGRVGWRRVLHGKTKELNTTIEMVKRVWFKP